MKWFDKAHNIRIADSVLNEHFGGTYLAYLVFEPDQNKTYFEEYYQGLLRKTGGFIEDFGEDQPELAAALKTQLLSFMVDRRAPRTVVSPCSTRKWRVDSRLGRALAKTMRKSACC